MSNDTKYNGWSNYATWRINLEMFDSLDISEFHGIDDEVDPELICVHTLADALKERAEYYIEESSVAGIARDYAFAFLSDVNFYEIAQHFVDDWVRENA